MDRKALAACAGILLPIGAVFTVGCDVQGQPAPRSTSQLVELRDATPGPWRSLSDIPIVASAVLDHAPNGPDPDETIEAEDDRTATSPAADSDLTTLPSDEPDAAEYFDNESPEGSEPTDPDIEPIPEQRDAEELAPQGTALPWANRGPRTSAMAAVAVQADGRIRHGVRLAERGAFYSARAEFVAALQLIAQASDAQQDTRLYTSSLVSGLTAIREASGFVRSNASNGAIDLKRIIAGHKTPVLKHATADELSSTVAAQKYYTYGQEQLAVAASQEMTASMALFGLGKAAVAGTANQPLRKLEYIAQAMTFYQAALMGAPGNFRAANELGVLLAENGNLPRAREVLIHSVTLSPQAATWLNLQVVHARLGEYQLAERARQQAELLRPAGSGPVVQWVDADTFARTSPLGDGLTPPSSAAQSAAQTSKATPPPAAPANMAKKGISDWLPKNLRR